MNLRTSMGVGAALLALVSCSNKRDLGNVPDGGAAGQGGGGGGTGGAGGGTGGDAAGGGGGTGGTMVTRPCDPMKPFGAPTPVPNVNSSSQDNGAELADDLTLYFGSDRGGGGRADIYVATRASASSSFATPQELGLNGAYTALWPRLTRDELTMYYVYYASSSSGGDIYVTSRSSVAVAFAPGAAVAQVNQADEGDLFVWQDGEALYFVSNRAGGVGGYDIYVATRRTDGSYATPQPVSELNSTAEESNPVVTQDGLRIYWASNRADGDPAGDIWTATRSSTSAPFGGLVPVTELNSTYADWPSWISPDGCKIYITTTRPGGPGGQDIWEASRPPVASGITEYPVPTASSEPVGLVAGPDGNIWFTEYSVGKIGRITPAGVITEFASGVTQEISGITVGSDSNIWFTESGADKIGRMTAAGGSLTEFPLPSSGSFPEQIAPGPDGNLWFTERHANRIGRVTPDGVIAEFSIPTASSEPIGIVTGPDGNLWFDEFSGNKIGRITTAGAVTEFLAGGNPSLITAGMDGNLWFTEEGGEKIARITTSGSVVEYPVPTAAAGPQGITSGPDGNLWFTEEGGNKIGRVTPAGVFTEFVVPSAGAYPVHIVAGPDGAFWFSEEFGNRIGRFVP
jgi:streptogramin lyase